MEKKKIFRLPNDLVKRTVSASLLSPVFLAIVYKGGEIFWVLLSLIYIKATAEWLKLFNNDPSYKNIFFQTILIILCIIYFESILALLVLSIILLYKHVSYKKSYQEQMVSYLGSLYIAAAIISMFWLRNQNSKGVFPSEGTKIIFWICSLVWATDISAYCIGKLVGGPKLCPQISPNKTWSGFIGGTSIGVLITIIMSFFIDISCAQSLFFVTFTIALSLLGQAGDLLQSSVKRYRGVKNSGNIIPGHGGVLDRFDSLFLVCIVVAMTIMLNKNFLLLFQ